MISTSKKLNEALDHLGNSVKALKEAVKIAVSSKESSLLWNEAIDACKKEVQPGRTVVQILDKLESLRRTVSK